MSSKIDIQSTTLKQKKIISMFDDIANTYDVANTLLSGGVDKIWRKTAIKLAFKKLKSYKNKQNIKILDVACGSGDMIFYWQKIAKTQNKEIAIQGFDASKNMLKIAQKKFKNINFSLGDCAKLPYENNSFNIISISYGLRNVMKLDSALDEFYRVLKPNGVLVILEFMQKEKLSLKDKLIAIYMNKILPFFGGLISKNKKAYSYLSSSIINFLTSKKLKDKLKDKNFKHIYTNSGFLNISTTFIAVK